MADIFELFFKLLDGCFLYSEIYFLIILTCVVALFSSLILFAIRGKY